MWRNALVLMAMVAGVAAAQDAQTSPDNTSPNAGPGDPVVRVTLNSNSVYDRGDRARVFVRVRDDGYVVVLQATPDGRVRPLFPAQPTEPNHIAAGTKFEVRSDDDHEAFRVNETHGTGMVYVAFSLEPFKLDNFMSGDHWDQDAFPDSGVNGHEEAVMTDLVQQMATGAHFDYDLATYRIAPPFRRGDQAYADNGYDNGGYSDDGNYAASYYPPPVVVAAYGPNPWWWGPTFYDPWYDPWYGYYPYAGYGWGGGPFIGVGFGFGGCWGCGFYAGGGPFFHHRPGWGFGYHPGFGGIGYRGRYGVYGTTGVFAGRPLGGPGAIGYRGRVGTAVVGTRSVFANTSLTGRGVIGNRPVGMRAGLSPVGSRTVFPQTAGRSAPVPANSGRVMAPVGGRVMGPSDAHAVGTRVTANRVPAAAAAGGGFEAGRPMSSPGYGAGNRAPMPTAHRVQPSPGGGAQPFDRTMSAPRSGGGFSAPRGGSAPAPRGVGGGGSHGGGGFHGGGGGGGGHASGGGGGHGGGGGGHGGGGHH
jgi:hypothetical protein